MELHVVLASQKGEGLLILPPQISGGRGLHDVLANLSLEGPSSSCLIIRPGESSTVRKSSRRLPGLPLGLTFGSLEGRQYIAPSPNQLSQVPLGSLLIEPKTPRRFKYGLD